MGNRRTSGIELGRRRLTLLLLAVIAPSLTLIVLSLRMLSQDTELAESRRTEEHAQAIREFGQMTVLTADRYKSEAISTSTLPAAVVFTGLIENGEIILPWQQAEPTRLSQSNDPSAFATMISEAERLEFRNVDVGGAIQTYRRALEAARDSVETAYAQMYLARALQKAGEVQEASHLRRQLISTPLHIVDEFEIPFAFFAAQSLATDSTAAADMIDLLERLRARRTLLSPQAAFNLLNFFDLMVHTVSGSPLESRVDSLAPTIQATAELANRARQLQQDFNHLYALLISASENSGSTWTLNGDEHWLIGISYSSWQEPSQVVVVNASLLIEEVATGMQIAERGYESPTLSGTVTPTSQWLGPSLPGVHLVLTRADEHDQIPGLGIRYAFILLVMVLVVGLSALGAYLWWRDTKREVQLAQLRSDFVSSVSHELKTPLTSIRMFAETLRFRTPSDEARRKYQDTILSESGRLTRLLNNVLDFSKIEKGTKRYNFEPVVLQRVIDAAVGTLAFPFRAKGFSIETRLPEEDVLVSGDRDSLEQVILNLLSNAMKFSRDRKEIVVRLHKNESEALLEVQDFGIGIEDQDATNIFDRFFRAPSVRDLGIPGTGLGLSIAHHAVEAHNGRIAVTSIDGEGSTFIIHLPLFEYA